MHATVTPGTRAAEPSQHPRSAWCPLFQTVVRIPCSRRAICYSCHSVSLRACGGSGLGGVGQRPAGQSGDDVLGDHDLGVNAVGQEGQKPLGGCELLDDDAPRWRELFIPHFDVGDFAEAREAGLGDVAGDEDVRSGGGLRHGWGSLRARLGGSEWREAGTSAAFGYCVQDLGHWNGGPLRLLRSRRVGGRSSCRLGLQRRLGLRAAWRGRMRGSRPGGRLVSGPQCVREATAQAGWGPERTPFGLSPRGARTRVVVALGVGPQGPAAGHR